MPAVERIDFRIDPDKKAAIAQAAAMEGLSTSDFIKRVAYLAAIEKIQIHVHLSGKDAELFAQSMVNPPKPNAALKRLLTSSNS